jgi:hypothetical protein
MRNMSWLTAIALAIGCASTGQQQAQKSSAPPDQATVDAQSRATIEQQKAGQAHDDVIAAQRALANAEARSRAQQARADKAQADVQRLEQGAAWTVPLDVQGSVIGASGNMLSLRTSDAQRIDLNVSDSTAVTLDGRSASVAQLQPGEDVRASYQMVDGRAQALRIHARSQNQ